MTRCSYYIVVTFHTTGFYLRQTERVSKEDTGLSSLSLPTRIQADNPDPVEFHYEEMALSVCSIARLIWKRRIDVIILFVDMRHRYLFPTYLIAKGILRRRIIYCSSAFNLGNPKAVRNLAYRAEHALSDAIILLC